MPPYLFGLVFVTFDMIIANSWLRQVTTRRSRHLRYDRFDANLRHASTMSRATVPRKSNHACLPLSRSLASLLPTSSASISPTRTPHFGKNGNGSKVRTTKISSISLTRQARPACGRCNVTTETTCHGDRRIFCFRAVRECQSIQRIRRDISQEMQIPPAATTRKTHPINSKDLDVAASSFVGITECSPVILAAFCTQGKRRGRASD